MSSMEQWKCKECGEPVQVRRGGKDGVHIHHEYGKDKAYELVKVEDESDDKRRR